MTAYCTIMVRWMGSLPNHPRTVDIYDSRGTVEVHYYHEGLPVLVTEHRTFAEAIAAVEARGYVGGPIMRETVQTNGPSR